MKKIKNYFKKNEQSNKIDLLSKINEWLEHIYNICIIYLREVLHFPRNIVYLNGFILVIGVLGNETYESIFEMFKLVNTVDVYVLIFYFMMVYEIIKYIYNIIKTKKESETLICRKTKDCSDTKIVRAMLYENGNLKSDNFVEIDKCNSDVPLKDLTFCINNIQPSKVYRLEIEEIEYE